LRRAPVAGPLIRPSATFSPLARGEGKASQDCFYFSDADVRKTRDGDAVASYRIVRVNNVEVYENLDGVLETILAALERRETW
jgi:hypothetical protein